MTEPYTKALEETADKLLNSVEVRDVPFGKKVYFLGWSMQGNSRSAQAVRRAEKFKEQLAKILGVDLPASGGTKIVGP